MRLVILAPFALAVGCAYDWSVGPAEAVDSSIDAASDTRTDTAVTDTGTPDTHVDCADLLIKVDAARTAAKVCTSTAGACSTTVLDECGCDSVVAKAASKEANAFESDAKAARDAKCMAGCGSTCPTPMKGFCLPGTGGGTVCRDP